MLRRSSAVKPWIAPQTVCWPRVDYLGAERYDPETVRDLRDDLLAAIPRSWAARLLRTSARELIRLEARGAVRPEINDAGRVIYDPEAFEAAKRALAAAPLRAATLARRMRMEARRRPVPRRLRPLDTAAQARADARAERARLQQIRDEAEKAAKRERNAKRWFAKCEAKERERRHRETRFATVSSPTGTAATDAADRTPYIYLSWHKNRPKH